MNEQATLNVSSRLEAALAYMIENSASKIGVNAVCKLAKVNRSNVYQCHREFLLHLSAVNKARSEKNSSSTKKSKKIENQPPQRDLVNENQRLLLLCIEYKLRITELEEKLAFLTSR